MAEETLLLVSVGVVALIIGYLIGKSVGSNDKSNKIALEVEKELESYKEKVSQHFGETADLIDDLTKSYEKVFMHLGSSAKNLLSKDAVDKHISSRAAKAITLTYDGDNPREEVAAINPMEEAQIEIQTEVVEEKATEDAKKMAVSMSNDAETKKQTTLK